MPQPLSPPHADALPATTQTIYRALGTHQVMVNCNTLGLLTECLQCFDAVGWAAGRATGL